LKTCTHCGQIEYSEEEYKKRVGSAYLTAISDKEFLAWLEKGENNEKI